MILIPLGAIFSGTLHWRSWMFKKIVVHAMVTRVLAVISENYCY